MMFNFCEAIARAAKDARTIGAGYLKVTVDGETLIIKHLPCNIVETSFDLKLDSFAKHDEKDDLVDSVRYAAVGQLRAQLEEVTRERDAMAEQLDQQRAGREFAMQTIATLSSVGAPDNCPRPECADTRGQSQLKINESGRIVECRACEGHGTLRYTDTYGPCQRCQPQSYAAWCADGRPKPTTKTSIATQVMTRAQARERYPDHHAEIDAVGCAPHDPLAGIPSTVPQATQESPLLSELNVRDLVAVAHAANAFELALPRLTRAEESPIPTTRLEAITMARALLVTALKALGPLPKA